MITKLDSVDLKQFSQMLPIYTAETIRKWDAFTIENEPISSLDLMERAALRFFEKIVPIAKNYKCVHVICGNGNNGGDGLAIARMLFHAGFEVKTWVSPSHKRSFDNQENLNHLQNLSKCHEIPDNNEDFAFGQNDLIIDAIFGTGLSKPVEGFWARVITQINNSKLPVISIDMPSGLPSEPTELLQDEPGIIKAGVTLTLQIPKLSLLIPGWGDFAGYFEVIDIGLHPDFIKSNTAPFKFVTPDFVKNNFKPRAKFSHKGSFGHALIMAGNAETCGAGILSASACMHSGAGLVNIYTDPKCTTAINSAIPEVMVKCNWEAIELSNFTAIGFGPGIGINSENERLLKTILDKYQKPLLIDADGITLLSKHPEWQLPPNTILTPHPKEFDRLAGPSQSAFERLSKAQIYAQTKNVIVVLKGAHTAVCLPNGEVYFNSTGNSGMATAGSGDVLTGIITAFLTQGYSPEISAILGVYFHGKAGDHAADEESETSLTAGAIIRHLGQAFKPYETRI